MPAAKRWAVVALGVALLLGVPFVVRAWPVEQSTLSAPDAVALMRSSTDVSYTGRVSSRGGVELPTDQSLSSVAKLLGRDGTLRVWWQDPRTWRVATMRTTGETDLLHRAFATVRWVYESKNVTVFPDVPIRLPNSSDVLPPVLALRLLDGARPEEVSRLPEARVAGRAAVGVRLSPDEPSSSVGHVDIWADQESGLPLRVELFGTTGPASLATSFTSLDLGTPDAEALRFEPPPESRTRFDDTVDLAAAADKYAERLVPTSIAGLEPRGEGLRSVGVYGRGPTLLLAVPLRSSDADDLRRELRGRPGASCLVEGDVVVAGPLQMMVTGNSFEAWLLAGTVNRDAVVQAARDLADASPTRLVSRFAGERSRLTSVENKCP